MSRTAIIPATREQICELISWYGKDKFTTEQDQFFRQCVIATTQIWTFFIDDELACMWGLIPPTLLSNYAYLWLYTTPWITGNEFIFIRKSQIVIQDMLKEWVEIRGHVLAENRRGIRWLKWLGANFGTPEGLLVPFSIRKHLDG